MRKLKDNSSGSAKVQGKPKPDLEGITENDLLEELAEHSDAPEFIRDDDVTSERLMNKLHSQGKEVSKSWCERYLKKECDAKRLKRVRVIFGNRGRGYAYRRP